MTGSGLNGGRATGNAVAASNGGVAIAQGNSVANGWNARSNSNAIAASNYGVAIANDSARPELTATPAPTAPAGPLRLVGWQLLTECCCEGTIRWTEPWLITLRLAAVDYGVGIANGSAQSNAYFGGRATSNSGAYSIGVGGFRSSGASATSGAFFGGQSISNAFHIAP